MAFLIFKWDWNKFNSFEEKKKKAETSMYVNNTYVKLTANKENKKTETIIICMRL